MILEKKEFSMFALLIAVILVVAIYLTINEIRKQQCYNMPINQYVEDARCEKYTFEDYIKENR
jgi:hypothetical protein